MPVDLPSRGLGQIPPMMAKSRYLARGLSWRNTPRAGVGITEQSELERVRPIHHTVRWGSCVRIREIDEGREMETVGVSTAKFMCVHGSRSARVGEAVHLERFLSEYFPMWIHHRVQEKSTEGGMCMAA